MKVIVLQEAQLEFLDTISQYEAERPGLGWKMGDRRTKMEIQLFRTSAF